MVYTGLVFLSELVVGHIRVIGLELGVGVQHRSNSHQD